MTGKPDKNWPKDESGRRERNSWLLHLVVPVLALGMLAIVGVSIRSNPEGEVIVYCAQDQTYAEPLLREFEEQTGIRVKAVYDSEAVKTVGLANRLLAERSNPRCDVFWGNEEMRTRQLAAMNVWRETNGFASFGARVRCLVINTNLLQPSSDALGTRFAASPTNLGILGTTWNASLPDGTPAPPVPRSLLDLTNEVWRGKVAIAFPQFGTTAAHFHVLRQKWGDDLWQEWCRGLVANETKVLDGNSTVVRMVGRGEVWIGLTDTDDVAAGQRDNLPVARGPTLPDTLLLIPNTVGIVRNAPHPENAQVLADWLRQPKTVERLLEAGALQCAAVPESDVPPLEPDWDRLLAELEPTADRLNHLFLR